MNTPFPRFRKVAFFEGISFLVLLLIAMPLKYFFAFPKAVTIVGSVHGLLFVAFIVTAWEVKSVYKKDFKWLAKAMLASVLPGGTFYMEKEWKREEEEAKNSVA
jgi:integral membrane protein